MNLRKYSYEFGERGENAMEMPELYVEAYSAKEAWKGLVKLLEGGQPKIPTVAAARRVFYLQGKVRKQ